MRSPSALALAVLAACGGTATTDRVARDSETAPPAAAAPSPPDSLVLTTADGYSLWFTDPRAARSADGVPCEERSLEIRRDSVTRRVPLLYTRSAPVELEPGFVRAELSLNCRTMAIYRVELATGRPTKLEDR